MSRYSSPSPSSPVESLPLVIEILDLTENRVIARGRFDEYMTAFLAPGVIGAVMDEGMETYYQVWDLSVDR